MVSVMCSHVGKIWGCRCWQQALTGELTRPEQTGLSVTLGQGEGFVPLCPAYLFMLNIAA
jgi:hypothetical protein